MRVLVVDDTRAAPCEGGCAVDWGQPAVVETAIERLRERFGEAVSFSRLDLAGPGAEGLLSQDILRELAGKDAWPVLLIDGRRRISGPFDLRMLLDAVQVETEMNT